MRSVVTRQCVVMILYVMAGQAGLEFIAIIRVFIDQITFATIDRLTVYLHNSLIMANLLNRPYLLLGMIKKVVLVYRESLTISVSFIFFKKKTPLWLFVSLK